MRQDCIFFCPIRVRYAEVDQQGIVYNGNYLTYTDVAFTEFMRYKGHPYKKFVETTKFEVCHIKSTFEFKASAFEDDLIEAGVRVLHVGTKSFTLGFELYRENEDNLLVYAECVYTGYDPKTRSSRPLTDLMRSILTG